MGRRKISIQPITDERNRKVTFVKRKAGLFKKAHELAVLCQVDLAVIILGNNNSKFYEYNSVSIDELLNNYKDPSYNHDRKTPGDYGDYNLESRVIRGTSVVSSHQRNTPSVSFAENASSEDEEDDDEEDDDDEEEEEKVTKPPPKKRKTQPKKEPKRETRRGNSKVKNEVSDPQNEVVPVSAPSHDSKVIQQNFQQQQQQLFQNQHAHQLQLQQQDAAQDIGLIPGQSLPPDQAQGIFYNQEQKNTVQPQYGGRRPNHINIPPNQYPPVSLDATIQSQSQANPPRGTFTPQGSHIPLNPYPPYPVLQFSPSTPISTRSQQSSSDVPGVSTPPIVPNSQNGQPTPYSTARARSLNDNINSRPILRVETHLSQLQKPTIANQAGDSANTVTAIDTSKNDQSKVNSAEEKTPISGELKSPDSGRPAGLGITSNKSTPLSATLPSGLFNLPPPQSSQHHNQQPPHLITNSKVLLGAGEQTPLTGGLPSRYVPDLFPSPSNFYSNEWNIPFGSGNTPYPNSAGPTNHTLPAINTSSGLNNGKGRLKNKLLGNDVTDSPLTNLSKESRDREDGDALAKRIKFNQNTNDSKKESNQEK